MSEPATPAVPASPVPAAPVVAPGTPPASSPPTPPQGPLASYWEQDKGALNLEKLTKDFQDRNAVYTQHVEHLKNVPAKPDEYKLALPETFKVPEGTEAKFDDKNPVVQKFLQYAHERKLSQQDVSNFLALQTEFTLAQRQADNAATQAFFAGEAKKMGGDEAIKARQAPIHTWLQSKFSPEMIAEARMNLSTEAGTRLWEGVLAEVNGSSMPGRVDDRPTPPPEKSQAERWYGADTSQRKAS